MHGLFIYNGTAFTILKTIGGGDPANLRKFSARFAAPMRPGDVLETQMWRLGVFDGEFEETRVMTLVKGKAVLSHGGGVGQASWEGKSDMIRKWVHSGTAAKLTCPSICPPAHQSVLKSNSFRLVRL